MQLPRYTLRTLFVIVTAIALFLGWQVSIIHTRRQLCSRLEQQVGERYKPYNTLPVPSPSASYDIEYNIYEFDDRGIVNPEDLKTIPWYRRLMGDQPHNLICLPPEATPADEEEYERAFPEADVKKYPPEKQISHDQ